MRLQQMKVALIRESGFPIGYPAPMYLNCPCGQRLYKNDDLAIVCTCGAEYDPMGWVLNPSPAVQSRDSRSEVETPMFDSQKSLEQD